MYDERKIAYDFYTAGLSYVELHEKYDVPYWRIKCILDQYQTFFDGGRRRHRESDPVPVMTIADVKAYAEGLKIGDTVKTRKRVWYEVRKDFYWSIVDAQITELYAHHAVTTEGSIKYEDLYRLNVLKIKTI